MAMLFATATAFAVPAMADTVTAEVGAGNVAPGAASSVNYLVSFDAKFNSMVNWGATLETNQASAAHSVSSDVSAHVGPRLPVVWGFQPAIYGELGESIATKSDTQFWGVGGSLSRQVWGPVSVDVNVRHREDFTQLRAVDENRFGGGANYLLNANNTVGVEYEHTSGNTVEYGRAPIDAVNLVFQHQF